MTDVASLRSRQTIATAPSVIPIRPEHRNGAVRNLSAARFRLTQGLWRFLPMRLPVHRFGTTQRPSSRASPSSAWAPSKDLSDTPIEQPNRQRSLSLRISLAFPGCRCHPQTHPHRARRRPVGVSVALRPRVYWMIMRSVPVRPKTSGEYISSALAGGTTNSPGVVAVASYV